MERYICIHGHFYQPPRENPWLEEVELQDSAAPLHDWNERITAECYGPNAAARLLNPDGRILDIVNNYASISFNMGPTLLYWMERHKPEVYRAILEADKRSMERFSGHGSAIAQAYNHMIMPLANLRDKHTQVIWGIRDFERRFGRKPEGMWLPETAADTESLEVLAEHGIRFTILAPRQARRVKRIVKGARWHDLHGGVDPTTAYLCQLRSGRSIVLFFYDGPISQDMAFSGLLRSGEDFANRLHSVFNDGRDWNQLVHVATDGESYGHHHRHGEMALSYCLHRIVQTGRARLTNYAEFLAKHPPTHIAEIHENSSWSCVHGVERWRADCGCNSGRQGWHQQWRKPLRDALDKLRDQVNPLFETDAACYLKDPWQARNTYIDVILNRAPANVEAFFAAQALRELSRAEKIRVLQLMELQRNCMLMYTSCGWFFDEISGIETTQVLQYAACAVDYATELFQTDVETPFVAALEQAPSNVLQSGAEVYRLYAKPAAVDLLRVGAHYGISSLFEDYLERNRIYCYNVDVKDYRRLEAGKYRLAVGHIIVTSESTWEQSPISFSVLHMGGHNVSGGVRPFMGEEAYHEMLSSITTAFERGHMMEVLQLIADHFGDNNYALWHLFRDEQRKVLYEVLHETLDDAEAALRHIYEDNFAVMSFLKDLHQPIPPVLLTAAELTVNSELRRLFEQGEPDPSRVEMLAGQAKRWNFTLDRERLAFAAGQYVEGQLEKLAADSHELQPLERLNTLLTTLHEIGLEVDRWRSQNLYFNILRRHRNNGALSEVNGVASLEWRTQFLELGSHLHVQVE